MDDTALEQDIGSRIAELLDKRAVDLARQWLNELLRRLPEEPRRIFPEQSLLNHIPLLLRRIAEAARGTARPLTSPFVREELKEIAKLRRDQGYDVNEIAQEFAILSTIIFEAIEAEYELSSTHAPIAEVVRVTRWLKTSLDQMAQLTIENFQNEVTSDRLERVHILNGFGRAVTHELRNRLNRTLLALYLLRQQSSGVDPDLLERLERNLRSIESVVGDVFTVTIANSRLDLTEGRRQSLRSLIRDVCADLKDFADERGVEVRLSLASDIPDIQVDAARVQLILINVLGNAVKYADMRKNPRWVEIRCKRTGVARQWQIDIHDNGIGIDPTATTVIFERHVRAYDGADREGHGIGLYLAKEATEQLGGQIWVESTPGEGSTFSFTLYEPPSELAPA